MLTFRLFFKSVYQNDDLNSSTVQLSVDWSCFSVPLLFGQSNAHTRVSLECDNTIISAAIADISAFTPHLHPAQLKRTPPARSTFRPSTVFTMNLKRLLWESKLAVALVLLIAARCVDRVLYTYVTLCLSLPVLAVDIARQWTLNDASVLSYMCVCVSTAASPTTTRRSSGTFRTSSCRSRSWSHRGPSYGACANPMEGITTAS